MKASNESPKDSLQARVSRKNVSQNPLSMRSLRRNAIRPRTRMMQRPRIGTARSRRNPIRPTGRGTRALAEIEKATLDQSVGLEGAIVIQPNTVASLPSPLQYELGLYAPGRVATPVVSNGHALPLRTGVATGSWSQTLVPPAASGYYAVLVAFYPVPAAVNASTPHSGLKIAPTVALPSATTLTSTDITNSTVAITDWIGTTTFADQLYQYAVEYDCEVVCPEANVNGVVWIGEYSVGQFPSTGGIKMSDLKTAASRLIELKDSTRWSVTARIQSPMTIAVKSAPDLIANEKVIIMWMENPSRSITTTDNLTFTLNIKGRINYAYWPDPGTPILSALVPPPVGSSSSRNDDVSEAATEAFSDTNGTSLPANPTFLQKIITAFKSGQVAKYVKMGVTMASTVSRVVSALMVEPDELDQDYRDYTAWLRWMQRKDSQLWNWDCIVPSISERHDVMDDAIVDLLETIDIWSVAVSNIRDRVITFPSRTRLVHGRDVLEYNYLDSWISRRQLITILAAQDPDIVEVKPELLASLSKIMEDDKVYGMTYRQWVDKFPHAKSIKEDMDVDDDTIEDMLPLVKVLRPRETSSSSKKVK